LQTIARWTSVLVLVLILLACNLPNGLSALLSAETPTPTRTATPTLAPPTYTPYPTCTPYPTYTPYPTRAPAPAAKPPALAADMGQNTDLAKAINTYRTANGRRALTLSYHLGYVAASRVQLTMITKEGVSLDLGQIQIEPRAMPTNYAWSEYTSGGNDAATLALTSPQTVLRDLVDRRRASTDLLDPIHRDIGAALLCNGQRCGYVVILGRPY